MTKLAKKQGQILLWHERAVSCIYIIHEETVSFLRRVFRELHDHLCPSPLEDFSPREGQDYKCVPHLGNVNIEQRHQTLCVSVCVEYLETSILQDYLSDAARGF